MAFHMPPGFDPRQFQQFAGGEDPRPAAHTLSPKEIARRLLAQESPQSIIKQFSAAPAHQRNTDALYQLYRMWMADNQVPLIQQLADACLLGHFSDSLLLAGGWQRNSECLRILWLEQVDFSQGNWPSDPEPVEEYWVPYQPPKPVAVVEESGCDALD
jgi:hypothetical protein